MHSFGPHCDQSPDDNDDKGLPLNYKVRHGHSIGAETKLTFMAYTQDLVTGEMKILPVDEYPNARFTLILPKDELHVYTMAPEASGRHCLGKMKIDGEWRAVIVQHKSTTGPNSDRSREYRSLSISDISFVSQESALAYMNANKTGPSHPFPSPPDGRSDILARDQVQNALKSTPVKRRDASQVHICKECNQEEATCLDASQVPDGECKPGSHPPDVCGFCLLYLPVGFGCLLLSFFFAPTSTALHSLCCTPNASSTTSTFGWMLACTAKAKRSAIPLE